MTETTVCDWCGEVGECSSEATGSPTCHACHHAMDWHRGCDPDDAPTMCPMCGDTLATHDHRAESVCEDCGADTTYSDPTILDDSGRFPRCRTCGE